jgi:POT family proton-dependent oligopeptide transporter
MSTSAAAEAAEPTWAGHPRGLATLFFTEMWERFSYYGMRAFLILYMTAPALAGGLELSVADAASIYGTYTGAAWGVAILGGLAADRFLGAYRAVLIGGAVIALGHVSLAFKDLTFFYLGLTLIVIGTGLLKPNVSTLVGGLYRDGDPRRDAGFSIFYMGINLGAFMGPLIAGYIAQRVDWHLGFGCAAIGMALGLTQYVLGKRHLQPAIARLAARPAPARADASGGALTREEWMRIGAIVVFFAFASIFWGAYEQAASTLSLFGDRYTRHEIFGFSFPSSWFQIVQPLSVIVLAPLFAWLWLKLGPREPSSPAKFGLGLLFMGVSFAMLLPAAAMAQSGEGIRRAVRQPRRPEPGDQAVAGASRGADDGRVVPLELGRQQARRLGRRVLQHGAADPDLRNGRGGDHRGRGRDVPARSADARVDGRRSLTWRA